MQFSIYQESRRGARRSNQDRIAYCYSKDTLLMLVADGMGGHLHGEMAAQIAMQVITEAFRREAKPSLPDPALFLGQAITGAHHAIIRRAAERGLAEAPRTTCVACVVQDGAACWAHAGDSRLYHIRDGRIQAQTKDHSRVQQLIDQGRIREEAIAAHPERNQIFNCLGSARPPQVELSGAVRLHAGDTLILCSDGLWSPLSSRIISSTVLKSGIMQAVPDLLDEAERRAGRECDNLSVVAVTWEEDFQGARTGQAPARGTPPRAAAPEQSAADAQSGYLSDGEIDRAIAEIRNEIKRHPNGKT
ncbi:MAG TPA: protein phosphatase 2C domain-containing protein [Burkholderiales bacterium]